MDKTKTSSLPIWVAIFAAILGLYCTIIGIVGLIDPTGVPDFIAGADNLGTSWAGRMAGTGVALLLAVWLRSSAAYVIAFGAAIFRELGDAIVAVSDSSEGPPLAVVVAFLAIDIVAFGLAIKASRSQPEIS